jgi:hypothetical protein
MNKDEGSSAFDDQKARVDKTKLLRLTASGIP